MRERRPGVWELEVGAGKDVVLSAPGKTRYRVVRRTVRGSERDAERALRKLVRQVDAERTDMTAVTLDRLLDDWFAHLEAMGEHSPTTVRTYRAYAAKTIRPALGRIPVGRLTAGDLDRLYRALKGRGLRTSTIRQHHTIISAALQQAFRWGWVAENVARRASPPRQQQAQVKPPTVAEIRAILEASVAYDPAFGMLVFLAVTTGARRGELCALRWSRVDLPAGTLTIAESMMDTGGRIEAKDTKTHQERRLALDPATVGALAGHRAWQADRAREVRVDLVADPFVCSQMVDGSRPYRPDRVTHTFRRVADRLGLRHVHLHSARHLVATQTLAAGVDLRTVAGRLGHGGGGAVTLGVYAHLLEAGDQRAAAVMGELVRPAADVPTAQVMGEVLDGPG